MGLQVLDRFNGSEKFLNTEFFNFMEGAYLRASSRVYDFHRAWVESCHQFVMNCWIRMTRRLFGSRVISRGRRRNGQSGVSVMPERSSSHKMRKKVYRVLLSNGSVLDV